MRYKEDFNRKLIIEQCINKYLQSTAHSKLSHTQIPRKTLQETEGLIFRCLPIQDIQHVLLAANLHFQKASQFCCTQGNKKVTLPKNNAFQAAISAMADHQLICFSEDTTV